MLPYRPPQSISSAALAARNGLQPQQTQQIGGAPLASTIPNYPFAPYQVRPNDTFDSIAQNNGLDLQSVTGANNGLLVPPPSGSFINLPAAAPLQNESFYTSQPSAPQNNRALNNVPAYAQPTSYNPYAGASSSQNPTTSPALRQDMSVFQNRINQQIAAGVFPESIPMGTSIINPQTGAPATFAQMMANGYVFRASDNSWVLAGSSAAGAPNANNTVQANGGFTGVPATDLQAIQSGKGGAGFQRIKAGEDLAGFYAQNNAYLSAKRWDPSRKRLVMIGTLIKEGRLDVRDPRARLKPPKSQPKKVVAPAPVSEATNAGTGPSGGGSTNQGGG